jgi:transposase-like protein
MRDWADELVARASTEGVELTRENGLLTALVRVVLQTGLEVELTDHLGYEPHAVEGRGSGNSRNGSYPKTVTTDIGKVGLRVPGTVTAASTRSRSQRVSAVWTG